MNIAPFGPGRSGRYRSAALFAKVQSALTERARRLEYLRAELLAEPAWDILLELYAFELVQHPVTVSELTDRINVPSTTSIRWMKMLEADDLIARTVDPSDQTLVWVALTSKGLKTMDGYFSAMATRLD